MVRLTVMAHITGQGGVAVKTAELAKALDDAGHEVQEVYFGQRPEHPHLKERLAGAMVLARPTPKEMSMAITETEPDIIIIAYSTLMAMGGLPSNMTKRPPTIGVVHGQGVLFSTHPPVRKTMLTKISGPLLDSLDRIVCINEYLADLVMERISSPDKVEVIPNGIFPDAYPSWKPKDDRTKRIVFAGSLQPEKRLDLLLEAVTDLNTDDVALTIIGDGPMMAEWKELASRKDINCEFTGWISDPSETIAGSDLLVLPSDSEGFPSILMEAAVIGIPVVASDIDGNRAVLGSNAIYFEPGDPADLTSKLEQVLDGTAKDHIDNARDHVISNFQWSNIIDRYSSLIDHLKEASDDR